MRKVMPVALEILYTFFGLTLSTDKVCSLVQFTFKLKPFSYVCVPVVVATQTMIHSCILEVREQPPDVTAATAPP